MPKPRSLLSRIDSRRRQLWLTWAPFGIRPCFKVRGEECPYHEDGCALWDGWNVGEDNFPCSEERRVFRDVSGALVGVGIPTATAAIVTGSLLQSVWSGDSRLRVETQRAIVNFQIEMLRAGARVGKNGEKAVRDKQLVERMNRLLKLPVSDAQADTGSD